ncbi:hypothetical protein [Tateyamaria sp.]|uniref:hypothetical protein n=1 Tax=Tateyamaria sp. TaxID=1929288 RepID=UPI003B20D335
MTTKTGKLLGTPSYLGNIRLTKFQNWQKIRQFRDIVGDLLTNKSKTNCTSFFWGGKDMLRTIALGSAILVQGIYVRTLPDGRMTVRVDGSHYSGTPVTQAA